MTVLLNNIKKIEICYITLNPLLLIVEHKSFRSHSYMGMNTITMIQTECFYYGIIVRRGITCNLILSQNSIEFSMPLKKCMTHYKQKIEIIFVTRLPICRKIDYCSWFLRKVENCRNCKFAWFVTAFSLI